MISKISFSQKLIFFTHPISFKLLYIRTLALPFQS